MPASAVPSSGAEVLDLPLDALQDSPFQVKRYDDARVRDLAETIRKAGLLQPATVRRVDGHYQLIAGRGRRAAVRYLRTRSRPPTPSAPSTPPSAASSWKTWTTLEPRR